MDPGAIGRTVHVCHVDRLYILLAPDNDTSQHRGTECGTSFGERTSVRCPHVKFEER